MLIVSQIKDSFYPIIRIVVYSDISAKSCAFSKITEYHEAEISQVFTIHVLRQFYCEARRRVGYFLRQKLHDHLAMGITETIIIINKQNSRPVVFLKLFRSS